MAEDWRVTVTFDDADTVGRLSERLRLHRVENDTRARLGGRVSVSGEGSRMFLYADSGAAAEEAEKIVRSLVSEQGAQAEFALDRWHPIEEEWEDGARPLPEVASDRAGEHRKLEAEETAESRATGLAQWEVRVEMPSHREAAALAERLQTEGWSPIRRWKYLIVGANDEDDAHALAKAIPGEQADAKVTVEPAFGMLKDAAHITPFAFFQ